ncbi:hypothetical protein PHAVU_007G137400 [Phaseolus vulgaris]|uniref:Phytocyanin domain-containing protein n=1 Tax=Phaseolus vulgaris TaxID=3885 RepID=V7BH58_PHAVU|nr:hypothetical protein PHAVU_007G137400g [Phaseolus vulgaris]ESW16208.1 hypothetical protein PHAVU_007G137400g [Phaseolus vulgaris]
MVLHQTPFFLSFLAMFIAFFCHCSATKFTVGDSAGWIIPPYPTYYNNWTHSHFIRAGDSIEFQFDDKFYNLIQVSQQEYEHCTSLQPLRIFNSSPVILPLKERGELFFTCSISNYCCLGQKIMISVHEGSSQNPPSPSPSPSQVPIIISPPQLSPNGSAPQPHGSSGMSSPPPSTGSTSGGNVGNPPVPPSTQNDENNAMALVGARSFTLSLGQVLSIIGAFFGFWVM